MVSVRSTDDVRPVGLPAASSAPLLAGLISAALAGVGVVGAAGLAVSGFTALLEITNRRRGGVAFNLGAFGALLLGRDVLLAVVTLRFNIYNQTKKQTKKLGVGSIKPLNKCGIKLF